MALHLRTWAYTLFLYHGQLCCMRLNEGNTMCCAPRKLIVSSQPALIFGIARGVNMPVSTGFVTVAEVALVEAEVARALAVMSPSIETGSQMWKSRGGHPMPRSAISRRTWTFRGHVHLPRIRVNLCLRPCSVRWSKFEQLEFPAALLRARYFH